MGRHVLFGVPVFTISVKLLVSFWLVGGLVEGQKIIRQKSSEKVLVGELLRFSTAFVNKKLCSYCHGLRCRGLGGAGCWAQASNAPIEEANMDLFLETPQQQAERMLRQQQRLMEMQMQGAAVQPPAQNAVPAVSSAGEVDPGAYSVQQDSYAQELAFDKRRARRRRWAQRLRTLAMIVLIPLGLAAIFLASYALTCILNGASPSEVLEHLAALGQRLGDVVTTICAGWES